MSSKGIELSACSGLAVAEVFSLPEPDNNPFKMHALHAPDGFTEKQV
jgi:hypothetical protein